MHVITKHLKIITLEASKPKQSNMYCVLFLVYIAR